jgi:sulfite reductase alpha subunit-like flavoprotein
MGLHPGYLATHSDDLSTPALMIGPGTGVAPLRALIYERLAWTSSINHPEALPATALAQDILLFGCRSSQADYFFRDEWAHLATISGLRHSTAFSRETGPGAAKREYVQDVIRRQAEAVRELLVERKGKLFVCGSSGNMPKGVRQAIVEVLTGDVGEKGDKAMSVDEAEAFLGEMEKTGRYWQETW